MLQPRVLSTDTDGARASYSIPPPHTSLALGPSVHYHSTRACTQAPDVDTRRKALAKLKEAPTVGHVLNELFEALCESTLIQPTFVLEHPTSISPLAKPHRSKPGVTERFELFIAGGWWRCACVCARARMCVWRGGLARMVMVDPQYPQSPPTLGPSCILSYMHSP